MWTLIAVFSHGEFLLFPLADRTASMATKEAYWCFRTEIFAFNEALSCNSLHNSEIMTQYIAQSDIAMGRVADMSHSNNPAGLPVPSSSQFHQF